MKKILLFMVSVLLVFGMVSCDQEVKVKTYKVAYNANGAVGNVPATIEVEEGGTATVPSCDSLSMKGYDFVGWNTKKDGGGRAYKESQTLKVASDIVLYAQWSVHEYSVSYKFDGGWYPEGRSNPTTYTIETESFTLNSPEKDGYEFLGWKTSEGEEPNKNVSIGKGTTGDLSFTAVWRLAFSIRYDANGGEGYVDRTYKQKGESVEVSQASGISREGYSFVCWNTSMGGSGMDYKPGDSYSEDADIRLYAKWTAVKYTISYDLDGGILPEGKSNPSEYTIESAFTLVNPEREGYVFVGWKVAGSSDETVEENLSISKGSFGKKSFTAVWKVSEFCTVKYDANGGIGSIDAITVELFSSISVCTPVGFELENQVFRFWNTKPDGTGTTYSPHDVISVDENMTLYAIWGDDYLEYNWVSSGKYGVGYAVKCKDKEVVYVAIPSEYKGKAVVQVDNWGFTGCSNLRNVEMPQKITYIGVNAFDGCSNLSSVTIPEGVLTIGQDAFRNCSSLTNVVISSSVSNIVHGAFFGCNNIKSVVLNGYICEKLTMGRLFPSSYDTIESVEIPEYVTNIGESLFSGCHGLINVKIPSSVTSIGSRSFSGCTSLAKIVIPFGVTSIDSWAFKGSGLVEITIPESVTSIGDSAFLDCRSLVSVKMPSTITNLGEFAFYGCEKLTEIVIPKSLATIKKSTFKNCSCLANVVITEGVRSIGEEAFFGCNSLTEIVIPEGVENIGSSVFWGCSNLKVITMPSSVTNIGSGAFWECYSLKEITIPEGVTCIRASTFYACTSLQSIEMPYGVTRIDDQAFNCCSSLRELTIPESVTSIGEYAFHDCCNLIEILIPGGVTSIGNYAFRDCNGLKKVTIPDKITSIGDYVFYGCGNLVEVSMPGGITSIGDHAFYGCSSLIDITIPAGVASIGHYAFYDCSSLRKIVIPEDVVQIGYASFSGCSGIASIKIPSSVAEIGDFAFSRCSSVESIEVDNKNIAYYSEGNCLIKKDTKELVFGCKTSNIPKDVTSIRYSAFNGCTGLVEVTIPDGVSFIGGSAFKDCISLVVIKIPESVTNIEDGTFEGCCKLVSCTLPTSVVSIGNYAFSCCESLVSIEIPESVTEIGYEAFNGCSSLTGKLVIPPKVSVIRSSTFLDCSRLLEVLIPEEVTSIGQNAFCNCSSLSDIHYEGTLSQWNAISKGFFWNAFTPDYTVHFSDGTTMKSKN